MSDVRLIDANALKTEMADDLAATIRMSEMRKTDMAVRVLNKIDEAPTIDAVTVARCRECKYATKLCEGLQTGNVACFFHRAEMPDDGFCHMGARMDGGAEG